VGAGDEHRLIGGVAVMLHVQRLCPGLPLRATGDADFGVPLHVLEEPGLIRAIEERGYAKVLGNRWERAIDERRSAAVDLLVPAYRTRARSTVRAGGIVTTEVPGLAIALGRPAAVVGADLRLTAGQVLSAKVVLPDAVGTLALEAGARTVRHEARDAEDLWRCLGIAAPDGVTPETLSGNELLRRVAEILGRELVPQGYALRVLTEGLQADAAARVRARLRALLAEVVGARRRRSVPDYFR